jgi:hypothetical protein
MTEPSPSKAELKRRLQRVGRDYEAAKARLAEVGFTCEGSLAELYTSCGNPNCRCADPDQRHGPYWQLTWKEAGKTITRRLSADDAQLYRQWIATAASSRRFSSRCATSPDKPTSTSWPPTAARSTAPNGPAASAAQPASTAQNPGLSRYPRVSRTLDGRSIRRKVRISRHSSLVLE